MLKLVDHDLSKPTQDYLKKRQKQIDDLGSFAVQAKKADNLWDSKAGSKAGKAAFKEIKEKLVSMSISNGLCNYCEHNEGSDIEHIAPKSLFPNKAFDWKNYLLACKHCNTGHKLDAMFVFLNSGSHENDFVERGTEPKTQEIAFLQMRIEEPMDFMKLSIVDNEDIPADFLFYAKPPHGIGTRGFEKVNRTLEILGMDGSRSLVHQRVTAFNHYKNRLKEYVDVKNASTFSEIDHATTGNPKANHKLDFGIERDRIQAAIRSDLWDGYHPTVWLEMIRQRNNLSDQIQNLFKQAPELIKDAKERGYSWDT